MKRDSYRVFALFGLLCAFVGGAEGMQVAELGSRELRSRIEQANTLIEEGRYAEAETLALELIREIETTRSENAIEIAPAIDALIMTRYRTRKITQPDYDLAQRSLAIRRSLLAANDPEIAQSLNMLGRVYLGLDDYAKATESFRDCLRIREEFFGSQSLEVATAVEDLAIPYFHTGDFVDAKLLFERSLSIRQEALEPDDPLVARSSLNLATTLTELGDYDAARPRFQGALDIFERTLGPDHPDLGFYLNNFANMLQMSGDYTGARTLHERAIALREKSLGPDSPLVAQSLINLGIVQHDLGEYASAKQLCMRAVETSEKAEDHTTLAYALENLAAVQYRTGDYSGAQLTLGRCLAISEEVLGSEHRLVAEALAVLAEVTAAQGDYVRSRECYERAVAISRTRLGLEHPLVALSLGKLGKLLQRMGDSDAAMELLNEALRIAEKTLGPKHPQVASSLIDLAELEWQVGKAASAFSHAERAEAMSRNHLRLTARTLPERQALLYAQVRNSSLDLMLSLAASEQVDDTSRFTAWDAFTRSRAIVLDEMAARHRTAALAHTTGLDDLWTNVVTARTRLANLTVRGPAETPIELYRKLLNDARDDTEEAERALAQASSEFRTERESEPWGLEDVVKVLQPGSALLAYVRYRELLPTFGMGAPLTDPQTATLETQAIPSYLAFLIKEGESQPTLLRLSDAAEIDALVASVNIQAARGMTIHGRSPTEAEEAYRAAGEALRQKIWDPAAKHLEGVERVFVIPDGALHLVSFAALPVGAEQYLVEAGPLLHYVSAERDLAKAKTETSKGRGLLALGGPDFDHQGLFAALAATYSPPDSVASRGDSKRSEGLAGTQVAGVMLYRGPRAGCSSFETLRFAPLPETLHEARDVVALWKIGQDNASQTTTHGQVEDALYLEGAQATETTFKERSPGKRVLHLATHAFFLGADCPSALDRTRGIGGLKPWSYESPLPVAGENPLLLSGLVLAGANHRNAAGRGEDDGVLTAEEIASLDLRDVEWAVLSACDTGLGKVQAGEGVFGLRRAFEVAGAGTVIMSLWSAEDEAARAWMRELYRSRLLEGNGTPESVRDAYLQVLRNRRERQQTTHPFYWAGFVAAGDWR